MTTQEMLSYIALDIKEPDLDHYTLADRLTLLNQGCMEVADKTKCLESSTDIAVVAPNYLISLPSDLLEIKRIWLGTSKLDVTYEDSLPDGWRDETGTPTKFIPVGLTKIRLYPKPIANITLTVDYYEAPATLVNAGESSDLPAWLHYLPCKWVKYKILELDKDASVSLALQEFNDGLGWAMKEVRKRKPKEKITITVSRGA